MSTSKIPVGIRKCSVCGVIPEGKLSQCSRCKEKNYLLCSKECQKDDWPRHKEICCKQDIKRKPVTIEEAFRVEPKAVVVCPVINQGDKLCFLYTKGLHEHGQPELFAIDVPNEKLETVMSLLRGLSGRCRDEPEIIFDGNKAQWDDMWGLIIDVKDERHRKSIIQSMGNCDLSSKIRMVKPVFDDWEFVLEPTGREEKVLAKWRHFRESQGSRGPEALEQALLKGPSPRGWETLCNLTRKEIKLVHEDWDYMLRLGLASLCSHPQDRMEAFVEDVAKSIHLAPRRYKRGIKVAQGHYTWKLNLA